MLLKGSNMKVILLKSYFAASLSKTMKRDISTNVPALQKASDPIQQLFLNKIREYKSKSVDGKLVDASSELMNELQSEIEKLNIQYGGGKGVNMTKFPDFPQFGDPPIDTSLYE